MGDGQSKVKWYLFWGCGAILLIPILAVFSVIVRTWVPLRTAEASQAELEQKFGPPATFVPAPHGELAPERVEAFLEVRRSMMEICPEFEALEVAIAGFEEEVSEKEKPTGKELVKVGKFFVMALGDLTPLVGNLFERRNEALLEAGMGIGEYVHLFTLAYGERLAEDDVKAMLFAGGESLPPQTGAVLRSMLVSQQRRASTSGAAIAMRSALDSELAALAEEPGRVPWQDGLPDPTLRSLAPFRERLNLQFCSGTAVMEIDLDPDRAMELALD